MSRIMGAPAGGAQQASDVVEMAPQTPYSQQPETTTPATSLNISNTPFDPYAAEAAQLEAMQAQTAALQSQVAGTTGTTRPAGLGEGKPWLTYADQLRSDLRRSEATGTHANALDRLINNTLSAGGYTEQTMFDPAIHSPSAEAREIAARPANWQPSAATAAPAQKSALRKPVNPGPRAPWQQSAQYWKDLETYKRAGGV